MQTAMNNTTSPREDIYPVYEDRNTTPTIAVVREFEATFMNEHGAMEKVTILVEPDGRVRAVPPAERPENQLSDLPKVL